MKSFFYRLKMLKYLITDPKYYTNNPIIFKEILSKSLCIPTQENGNESSIVDMACFRDKISSNKKELAKAFVSICKNNNIKTILINSDISLCLKLKANGVHLTSNQFNEIKKAKKNDLFVLISCHSVKEIKKAEKLGANMVTYSPIFITPNKGKPKGCDKLKKTINNANIPIIALGGIVSQKQIKQIKASGASGFASIRYFVH